eukprot:2074558-Pyramimonas_sp.AAC.1
MAKSFCNGKGLDARCLRPDSPGLRTQRARLRMMQYAGRVNATIDQVRAPSQALVDEWSSMLPSPSGGHQDGG